MTTDSDNIFTTPYGGEGLGIGEKYPVAQYGIPGSDDEHWGSASWSDLREAGFDRPGEGPTFVGEDGEPFQPFFFTLLIEGAIVAVWDEGRWWTPQESEAFLVTLQSPLMRQMAEATAMNREQRRRKKGGD